MINREPRVLVEIFTFGQMHLTANVQIYNRILPSLNFNQRRAERAFLTIGKTLGKGKTVYILVQTRNNAPGVRYKVEENVNEIFAKFIGEGKATIRFKVPAHDLRIKADANQLEKFLFTLKTIVAKDGSKLLTLLPNLATLDKVVTFPKVRLTVNRRDMLPGHEGYPRSLETIVIKDCGIKQFDTRILRLQELTVLMLEGNCLQTLPPQIELLPNLKQLHLPKNEFGLSNDWRWLNGKFLQKNLTHLNLRDNKLKFLPNGISKFKNLSYLNIGQNNLSSIPCSLGKLSNLSDLILANNKLKWLPASFQFLSLKSIDVSGNEGYPQGLTDSAEILTQSSLLDLAASAVIQTRVEYTDEMLPRELIIYLENAMYCICGTSTFPNKPHAIVAFCLRKISSTVVFQYNLNTFPMAIRTCSPKCYKRLTLS